MTDVVFKNSQKKNNNNKIRYDSKPDIQINFGAEAPSPFLIVIL